MIPQEVKQFKVVSYNILANGYASKSRYKYCHPRYLSWNYREANLYSEIRGYHAEVVCLQELEKQHYDNYFYPKLALIGYSGVFYPKQKDQSQQQGQLILDGCAIFWKSDVFKKDGETLVKYPQSEHIGIILNLSTHVGGKSVCICTTHITGNPRTPQIKIEQLDSLLSKVSTLVNVKTVPVIICGDFNSNPSSGVYKYMKQGKLPANYTDQDFPDLHYCDHQVSHGLELKSSYEDSKGVEPSFTVFTNLIKETVDYIWFTPGTLIVKKVDEHWKAVNNPLPTQQLSSDHIAIAAVFQWRR